MYIPLPNSLHVEWTIRALEAGKHVLCEKPLALSPDEVDRIAAAAHAADRIAMEGFMWRATPRIARTRELVAAGAVGRVRLVRASFTSPSQAMAGPNPPDNLRLHPELGGGVLTDLGCYGIDAILLFVDDDPVEIAATRSGRDGIDVDVTTTASIRFAGGAVGQFAVSMEAPRENSLEIVGDRGRIRLRDAFRSFDGSAAPLERQDLDGVGVAGIREEPFDAVDPFRLEIEHMAARILDGAEAIMPLAHSRRDAVLLDAARRSWAEGPVRL